MDTTSLLALGGFVAVNFLAALSGALFRPGEWYERLNKPWWRPPNWLFGPAWTVLYCMIATAGWLVWRVDGFGWPIVVYLVSLAFNAGWSAVFFGMRRPDLAFGELVLLWLSIAATILVFWPVRQDAALLLVPYLGWVTFAGGLNLAIWRLNPQTAGGRTA